MCIVIQIPFCGKNCCSSPDTKTEQPLYIFGNLSKMFCYKVSNLVIANLRKSAYPRSQLIQCAYAASRPNAFFMSPERPFKSLLCKSKYIQ